MVGIPIHTKRERPGNVGCQRHAVTRVSRGLRSGPARRLKAQGFALVFEPNRDRELKAVPTSGACRFNLSLGSRSPAPAPVVLQMASMTTLDAEMEPSIPQRVATATVALPSCDRFRPAALSLRGIRNVDQFIQQLLARIPQVQPGSGRQARLPGLPKHPKSFFDKTHYLGSLGGPGAVCCTEGVMKR